jgi:hypothetical protein
VLTVKPAKEVRGSVSLPPNPDLLFLSAITAIGSGVSVSFPKIEETPYITNLLESLAPIAERRKENDTLIITPRLDFANQIALLVDSIPYRDYSLFVLLGMGKTVRFSKLSDKLLDQWKRYARRIHCEIAAQQHDSGIDVYISSLASYSLSPESILEPEEIMPIIGFALGLKKTIQFCIDTTFQNPLRHLFAEMKIVFSVKSNAEAREMNPILRRIRLAQAKKRGDGQGVSFTIAGDFTQTGTACTVTLPGDDVLCATLLLAKSIVQRGTLTIENVLLEPWNLAMLTLIRRMGCKPGIQETGTTSFGNTGMVQLQRFDVVGRKSECTPLYQYRNQLPAMVFLCCLAKAQSVFRGLIDMRNEDPDPIEEMLTCIRKAGGRHGEMPDGIVIDGREQFDSFDLAEEIPAALAAASAVFGLHSHGTTTIADKSIHRRWPFFTELLDRLCEYRK